MLNYFRKRVNKRSVIVPGTNRVQPTDLSGDLASSVKASSESLPEQIVRTRRAEAEMRDEAAANGGRAAKELRLLPNRVKKSGSFERKITGNVYNVNNNNARGLYVKNGTPFDLPSSKRISEPIPTERGGSNNNSPKFSIRLASPPRTFSYADVDEDARVVASSSDEFRSNSRMPSFSVVKEDEPTEYGGGSGRGASMHSPKCVPKRSSSRRLPDHSRSSSSTVGDRVTSAPSRVEAETSTTTSHRYVKNVQASQRQTPPAQRHFFNYSFDGDSSADYSLTSSRESQMSYSEDGNPVAPPRKKRINGLTESRWAMLRNGTLLPQMTTSEGSYATEDDRSRKEREQVDVGSSLDSLDFKLDLPPGFSELDLDPLDIVASSRRFDPCSSIPSPSPRQKTVVNGSHASTAETYDKTGQHSVIKVSIRNKLESADRSGMNGFESGDSSNRESTVIWSTNHGPGGNDSENGPRKFRLKSEAIVQSMFGGCKNRSNVPKDDDDLQSAADREKINLHDAREKSCSTREPEGNCLLTRENLCDTRHRPETNRESDSDRCSEELGKNGALEETEGDRGTKNSSTTAKGDVGRLKSSGFISGPGVRINDAPDVIVGIGHQRSVSSMADSDESVCEDQEKNRSPRRSSTLLGDNSEIEKELSVFHQLQGTLSKSIVRVRENSTTQDVIKEILYLEKLPPFQHLYQLVTKTLDPRFCNNGFVELDARDCPLRHLRQKNRGGNIRFELLQKQGIQIQVVCKIGLHVLPKKKVFGISCESTCKDVVQMAVLQFNLKNSTADFFSLVQVDRTVKDVPMKRVKLGQVMAELHTDYFLLCESESLADSFCVEDESFATKRRSARLSSSGCGPLSPSSGSTQLIGLQKKLNAVERDLTETNRRWQQKLKKQQSRLDCYRAVAFCADRTERLRILEAELLRLTREMQTQEQQVHQVQSQIESCTISSHGWQEKYRELEKKLESFRQNLSAVTNEQMDVYSLLEFTRNQNPEEKTASKLEPEKNVPTLYAVCQSSPRSCLHCIDIKRSSFNQMEFLPGKGGLIVRNTNGRGTALEEGDRILEINGQPAHHLDEKELLSAVNEMAGGLRVVVVRDQVPPKDVYML